VTKNLQWNINEGLVSNQFNFVVSTEVILFVAIAVWIYRNENVLEIYSLKSIFRGTIGLQLSYTDSRYCSGKYYIDRQLENYYFYIRPLFVKRVKWTNECYMALQRVQFNNIETFSKYVAFFHDLCACWEWRAKMV